MGGRWLRSESYRQGLVLSSIANAFAKGLAFVSNATIAYFFGSNRGTDVLFYTMATTTLLSTLLTSLDSAVLVPEAMRRRVQEGELAGMKFVNSWFIIIFSGAVLLTLAFAANTTDVFGLLSRFPPAQLREHSGILILGTLLLPLMVTVTFATDVLVSYKFFTFPMLVSGVNSAFSIAAVTVFHDSLGLQSMIFGLVGAYTLHLVLLGWMLFRRLHWQPVLSTIRMDAVLSDAGYAFLGSCMAVGYSYVPIALLSGLTAGLVTALNFGQRVADLPTFLVTAQFSSVAAIKFNELSAKGDRAGLNRLFVSTGRFLLFLLFPIAGMTFVFADEIIRLLFQRGAFDAGSTAQAAAFLRLLIVLLPFLAGNTLSTRLFMASRKVKASFWYQAVMTALLVVGMYFGIQWFGFLGYLYALIADHLLSVLLIWPMVRFLVPEVNYGAFLKFFASSSVLTAVLSALLFEIRAGIEAHLSGLALVLAGSGMFLVLWFAAIRFLGYGEAEWRQLVHLLRRGGLATPIGEEGGS